MGKKYASIHVLYKEQYNLKSIGEAYQRCFLMETGIEQSRGLTNIQLNSEHNQMVNALFDLFFPPFYIEENDSGWSIYDENLGMDNIKDMSLKISQTVKSDILYSCNFDDDVFMYGHYYNGIIVSSHTSGELNYYGLTASSLSEYTLQKFIGKKPENIDIAALNLRGLEFEEYLITHSIFDFY